MASIPSTTPLVIFDIDGTLLATDRFWLEIGKRAVGTVYEREGVKRGLPTSERFLGAIGLPVSEFWKYVLPEELHSLTGELEKEAQELEEMAFASGVGGLYPGARQLLVDLQEQGRVLGLASNCGGRYLRAFQKSFDLHPVVQEARCLDSPGISSKAEMIGDIKRCTGIDDALLVGDRSNDREAARAAGAGFILFSGGFGSTQVLPNELVAHDYVELAQMLLAREGHPGSR